MTLRHHSRTGRITALTVAALFAVVTGCGAPAAGPEAPPSSPASTGPSPPAAIPSEVPTAVESSADRGATPTRIVIPAIDISSSVQPVGTKERVLEIPAKPWVVGWWRDGVGVGAGRGTAVMVAHLDSRTYGTGPFERATNLNPGDAATITDDAGNTHPFRVSSVDTYLKERLPYEQLFAQSGPERVVIVTCGGEYRRDDGGWDSNVVVTLTPIA